MAEDCKEPEKGFQNLAVLLDAVTMLHRPTQVSGSSTMLAWGNREIFAGFLPGSRLPQPSAAHSFPQSVDTGSNVFLPALDPLWVTPQIENGAGTQEKDPRRSPQYPWSFPQARPQEFGDLALHTWWGCQPPPSVLQSDQTVLEFLGSTGPPSESSFSVLA